jgi:hypothetical protein
MATPPDLRDPPDDLRESLRLALADRPLLRPVSTSCPEERRLWRACELATFSEYRLGGIPDKIAIFEAYARHCRFRVQTPRIPGLIYPAWDEL